MIRLLYRSISYVDRGSSTYTSDIGDLLVECLSNNTALSITGVLAFNDGKFAQVIEGPVEVVDRLMVSIERDVRHFDLQLVHRTRCDRREFPFWAMAYLSYGNDLHSVFQDLGSAEHCTAEAGERIVGKLARMVA